MSAVVLALLAGAVVGLALGGMGGGGSVLAVPALVYLLGFSPVEATTAGLVIVAITTATSLYAHGRDGNVRWRAGLLFAAAGLLPAVLGGLLAARLPDALLTAAFAVLAAAAAAGMLRTRDEARATGGTNTARAIGAGAGLGAVTGLLGVGGGFLGVPALVRVVGLPMRAAVGTSLLVITLTSTASLAARGGTLSALDWTVVGPFTAAAVLGAWDGRRLATRVSGRTLQRVFGTALLAVAALMLVDAFVLR
ncbi:MULTISPECIES: sulfite exporter TauE/SafE family protein [Streptomyces]|uniref:sulfite exporter TauE/SafE family protein n=1 Tax=Streptomyces TaxID=1883 RepID=UPI00101FD9EF|nr:MULTISPECIES: sulfite exporter TauE/SafE family protein [Streptomyces]RZF03709.1 integral membrane family protein [Streptomyces albidoflavus]